MSFAIKSPRTSPEQLQLSHNLCKHYSLSKCHGFMIFSYQYSTSQHHAVYWELKSKCFSSGYLSGREEELWSPRAFSSTVTIPAQGNRFKGSGHLTRPSSCLAVFPVRSARYCCSQLRVSLQNYGEAFPPFGLFLSLYLIY